MERKGNIVRATADEIQRMLERGESKTDWARVDAMSQEEVERLADEEEGPLPEGWEKTIIEGLPPRKRGVRMRLDADVIDWFKSQGRDYQARMNAALREFMETRRERTS